MKIVNFDMLRYNVSYFNFFQVFVYIFEAQIIRKMFPKYMDPVVSTRSEKNVVTKYFHLFVKWKYFSDISIK